ncbi:MAG: PAS domain S-box protein [Desulfobacterales bacterium]
MGSQESLKDFINSAMDSFVFFDSELNIIQVNKAHMEMFHPGMDQKDLIGKNLLEIVPNLKETGRFDDFMKVMETGAPFYSDDIIPHQKFGNRCLSVKAFKMNGGLGTITVDVTKRKQDEEALQKSEQKFRELVENINEVFYSVDDKGIVHYISSAMRGTLGYEPNDIVGRAFLDFIHPEDRLRILEKFQKVFSGQSGSSEYRVLSKTGEYRWIRSSSMPIYDNGRVVGLRGVFSDITKEKQRQGDLQQAQKMEAIGTLAGGIAHEFNNILAIILWNAELSIDDVPEWNPAKYSLEEIRTASLRAKGVVQQILSFAHKNPTTRKPIKIGSIIKESLKRIRVTIPVNIQIHQEILCDSEMILANSTEITQILVNLCSNSAHAMEEETGILEVRLETIILNDRSAAQYENLTAGAYVKLTVKDTGKGIDPKITNRIFDPYFTTKDVDRGSGMGLAVVIGIVKQHDGAIKVMSGAGKGTTAEVLFPVIEVQAETEVEESDDLPSGTERILFVDDEASLVKITKQLLERQGYEVVGKTNSAEALKLFQEEPDKFDLIITDMAMPEMPGDRLAQELIKIRSNIPIILCTGHSGRFDEEKAKELGIKAYTLKPLVKASLFKTVRKVLDEAKGSAHD